MIAWCQVSSYKGEKKPKFNLRSQLAMLRKGDKSEYYDDATLMHMSRSLDPHLERRAGFSYDDIFAQFH